MFKQAPIRKSTAVVLLLSFLAEWLTPLSSYALTSGPSQPEMQSFEPVGTTDMVNAFSGDFTYNIPLLDVEGYPVNIAYHSGVGVEDEASWVGLGWNINPGSVNHGVRGLPDDFNGETIEKEVNIKQQVNKAFSMGGGFELLGLDDKGLKTVAKKFGLNIPSVDLGINLNNYTGISSSFGISTGKSLGSGWISAGVNMNVNFSSSGGADIGGGVYGSMSGSSKAGQDGTRSVTGAINGSFGKGYNSREGLKYTSFGVNAGLNNKTAATKDHISQQGRLASMGLNNSAVPISSQNFVPVITNANRMESNFFQLKAGIEFKSVLLTLMGSYRQDVTTFDPNGNRRGYGYFNLQNADKKDITDFTRDRDGNINRTSKYLPSGSMTYDIYGISGQGTAGNFRAFRNDIGSVYDPYTKSATNANSHIVELGFLNLFEAGYDYSNASTSAVSGPWNTHKYPFSDREAGNLYEPHYFKQAGELTEASTKYFNAIGGHRLLSTKELKGMNKVPMKKREANTNIPEDFWNRAKRSNQFYFFTAGEASLKGVSLLPKLQSYTNFGPTRSIDSISRIDADRKAHHASEFTQILPDGRRYIYGLPAMNKSQIEYVVSCKDANLTNGVVNIGSTGGQNLRPYNASSSNNSIGQELFFKTSTPAYAHNYLLTTVLSPDYSDLTGDGISDDDLGSYTKFNYTRTQANYGWRAPYKTGEAQFDKGVASDCHDDKATFVGGNKEIWMLHSIETKNYIAEFHVSNREDAEGANDEKVGNILSSTTNANKSSKLDRIALYNKREWAASTPQNPATPIKEVIFTYDYSRCQQVPNNHSNTAGEQGKLTLRAISIKFGNSDMGLLSPYRFKYEGANPDYNVAAKDRWGSYKAAAANNSTGINLSNNEFPYAIQDKVQADLNASAWNLTQIQLPSGGAIEVDYEADDYAYVQDRRAMEMIKVAGIGASTTFSNANALYQNVDNPYLYVYFKRKDASEVWYDDMRKAYLGTDKVVQYNFKVKMSARGETTKSCGIPLEDHIKGYAKVTDIGPCTPAPGEVTGSAYGYIKLEPKNVQATPALKLLDMGNVQLNPVTLAAIFYARYYNNNALYPASEIVELGDKALITQLLSSVLELANYFRNPIAQYLNEGKAKFTDLSQSYVRLYAQGHKLGGGHRVKRIKFFDNWKDLSDIDNPVAVYGSEYDYTIEDPGTGKRISSGVASYEPLYGGDENPFKEVLTMDKIGQNTDFPAVIPTELMVEGPVGESLFPGASVGYSKVTITSIHKNEGASSQTIQEEEFYTARDFPSRTQNSPIEPLEDKQIKAFDLSPNKEEAYRVGQSYALFFNDMHGKAKGQTTYVAKSGGDPKLVSYKKYNYFTNPDGTLKNDVPCISLEEGGLYTETVMVEKDKTLGVETDLMIDNRAKDEYSETLGFAANLNTFILIEAFPIPIPIPTGFPHVPQSVDKHFSSVVSTKIVQQYGILHSVETFDKGASVVMTNERFDANTGLALVTKVSTEHNDNEIQVKYPAYWAYRCMGAASHNILYEEDLRDISVVDGAMYIQTAGHRNFNVGDELLLTCKESCAYPNVKQVRKMWIVDKTSEVPPATVANGCKCTPDPNKAISYTVDHYNCTWHGNPGGPPMDFSTAVANGQINDKLCRLAMEDLVDYDRGMKVGIDLNTSKPIFTDGHGIPGIGSLKQRILYIQGNVNYNSALNNLKELFIGTNSYPIENLHFRHESVSFEYDHAVSTAKNVNIGGVEYLIFPNNLVRHGSHYGHKDGANYYVSGTVGNLTDYQTKFDKKPLIGKGTKMVKLTVSFGNKGVVHLASSNPNISPVPIYNLFDKNEPHNILTNNFQSRVYTIHLPYDDNYNNSLKQSDLTALYIDNLLYDTDMMPSLTQNVILGVDANGQATTVPFPGNLQVTKNGVSYDRSFVKSYYYMSCKAEIVDRAQAQPNASDILVARPHDRMDVPAQGPVLPLNDYIQNAHVKVIRSGRRNQLLDNIQDVSLVSKDKFLYKTGPTWTDPLKNKFSGVIAMSAQTYTDETGISEALKNPASIYNNPFVTGNRGTYRPDKQYDIRRARDYPTTTAANKGLLNAVESFWALHSVGGTKAVRYLTPNPQPDNPAMWVARMAVSLFSPYGMPLQVQDAAGNIEATLYGYNNQLPVAKVVNTSWDNALYENFEDYLYTPATGTLQHFQNLLHRSIYFNSGNPSNIVTTAAQKHTGQKSLQVNGAISLPFPAYEVVPATFPGGATPPFHFRGGRKYLFSYWQKVDQNSFNPTSLPLVSLSGAGITATAKPKTPPIDGWVLYEGAISLPASANGNMINLNFSPGIYDDLRILPVEANMKCFVYNATNRKLAATLDENHMASLFEYDAEGKLVRIKKETERGILTIKESRSGVHSIFPENGNTVNLKN